MKKAEYYINLFPLEDLLPKLDETEVQEIVRDCDYTFEANKICQLQGFDNKVNSLDAMVFYEMGYQAAYEVVKKKLKPLE